MKLTRRIIIAGAMSLLCASAGAEPKPQTQAEVKHLLDYLVGSGCQFNRNGSWYDGPAARDHLRDKYEYLVKRDLVPDAESFIARAASSSSISGRPYLVKCGDKAPVQSAVWLTEELKRWRAQANKGS
jgi:hypothetical protein